MNDSKIRRPSFASLLRAPVTVRRALKVAAIVGTLLIAINQGDVLLAGEMPALWKIALTYFVPYIVSSYSTAALLREQARAAK
ncbi:MAG: nitrate/nitrite transporter NrtS [Sphingomonadaceae bacterium]|nr:nitrate/nitrite transporter NrtS [Sphingomonadaceae bacterium]